MPRGDPNRNLVAALSYFLLFITGIVILLVEKEDKYIRFHAMQSLVIFGSLFIASFVLSFIFKPFGPFGIIYSFANFLIWLVTLLVWAVSMFKAYQGQMFKWPIAGDFAEKRVAKSNV